MFSFKTYTIVLAEIPYFCFLQEEKRMSNISDCERFRRIDRWIWKKTRIDSQGRVTLPQKLRQKLGLNHNSSILWICANRKNGKDNEYVVEIGVKK
jgi:DNA-binding transcriptional regulator/RsmH inhibitor MraZ